MFAYRLAKELGYANPDAMMAEMELQHFDEWLQYFEHEQEQQKQHERKTNTANFQSELAGRFGGKRHNIRKS